MYLAAQLLSSTVAKAIPECLEDAQTAATVVQAIDDGFDALNSRQRYADKPMRCGLGVNWEAQASALRQLERLMERARFGRRQTMLPFQHGFLMSIHSTLNLFRDLQTLPDFKFLLTTRLNQDALESLFSTLRSHFGANHNPTSKEVLYRLRLVLLGASPAISSRAAVRPQSAPDSSYISEGGGAGEELGSTSSISSCTAGPLACGDSEQVDDPVTDPCPGDAVTDPCAGAGLATEEENMCSQYGLHYVAGYVAKKARHHDPTLGQTTSQVDTEDVPSASRWISILSRGNLTLPSSEWVELFKEFEEVFHHLHHNTGMERRNGQLDHLLRTPGVIDGLAKALVQKWPHLDPRVIREYARARTFIRMKHVARVRREDHLHHMAQVTKRKAGSRPADITGADTTRRDTTKARLLARGSTFQ